MKKYLCFVLFLAIFRLSGYGQDQYKFIEGHELTIIGKFHNEAGYARFPAKYESKLRPEVWSIGQRSTGISILFETNSSDIVARWTLAGEYSMMHSSTAGARGVDLYVEVDGKWRFIQASSPGGKTTDAVLLSGVKPVQRKYLLNLPLNVRAESVYIGVNNEAEIRKLITPLATQKPVVHYGSSITQAASASRPGMAYTNLLSRKLDRSFINLGFSGQGTFDESVGEAMCEIDAALYIIDCNPNTQEDLICERAIQLVNQLKKCRPDVPILMVENFIYAISYFHQGYLNDDYSEVPNQKQFQLRKAYDTLINSGITRLYYQKGRELIGTDQEGTVDGAHPNDLGLFRFYEVLYPTIQSILE